LNWAIALFLLGDALAFSNNVESVACFALLHDVLVSLVSLFFEGVAYLLTFVGVHFGQNVNFLQDFTVVGPPLDGSLLQDVSEGLPVELKQCARSFTGNCGSSWRIVHQR
jgi:hypothetical protein